EQREGLCEDEAAGLGDRAQREGDAVTAYRLSISLHGRGVTTFSTEGPGLSQNLRPRCRIDRRKIAAFARFPHLQLARPSEPLPPARPVAHRCRYPAAA